MDGLTATTSGGTVVRNDECELYRKPDVTTPGGTVDDLVNAVEAGDPDADGPVRDYIGKDGTSMAALYVNGVAGIVAEAMEFGGDDRPPGSRLPEPGETDGSEETDRYGFGPAEVSTDGETWIPVGGTTDTTIVVGRST